VKLLDGIGRSGLWVIREERLDDIESRVLASLDGGQVRPSLLESWEKFQARDMGEGGGAEKKRYSIDGAGRAHISISGPLLADTDDGAFWAWLLGGWTYGDILRVSEQATLDPLAREVVRRWNSPGGHVIGCAECAAGLRQLDAIKPQYSYAAGDMASGALWLGVQARRIYASPTALIGSIGVVVTVRDNTEMLKRIGISQYVVTDDAAPRKRPDFAAVDGLDDLRRNANRVAEVFRAAIAEARGVDDTWVREQMGRGACLVGPDARAAKLVDVITLDIDAEREAEACAEEKPLVDPMTPPPQGVPAAPVPSASPGARASQQEVPMDVKAAVEAATAELRQQLAAASKERDEAALRLAAAEQAVTAHKAAAEKATAELTALKAKSVEAEADAFVAELDGEGRVTPAGRADLRAKAIKHGVAFMREVMSVVPKGSVVPTQLVVEQPGPNGRAGQLDADAADALVQQKATEWGVSYTEAYDRLERERPGIFAGAYQQKETR